jgi:hypothetical protein
VGGKASDVAGFVARVRGDGRLDERFGDGGIAIATRALGTAINALARDGRGRIDRSFGSRGVAVKRLGLIRGVKILSSSANQVAVDDRGRIVVAGQSYDEESGIREDEGQPYPAIARLKG